MRWSVQGDRYELSGAGCGFGEHGGDSTEGTAKAPSKLSVLGVKAKGMRIEQSGVRGE